MAVKETPAAGQDKTGGRKSGRKSGELPPGALWAAGGVAAAGVGYLLWQRLRGGSSSTTADTGSTGIPVTVESSPTGLSNSQLFLWLTDHMGSTTTRTTETTQTPPGTTTGNRPKRTPPPPHKVTPPHKVEHNPRPPRKHRQKYRMVTVVPWRAHDTPWDSTLYGIAVHYHVKGGYQELAKINHLKNPNDIHPGQKVKVPVH